MTEKTKGRTARHDPKQNDSFHLTGNESVVSGKHDFEGAGAAPGFCLPIVRRILSARAVPYLLELLILAVAAGLLLRGMLR